MKSRNRRILPALLTLTTALLIVFVAGQVLIAPPETDGVRELEGSWLEREYNRFRAYPRLQKAMDAVADGDLEEARSHLANALEETPELPQALKLSAEIELKSGAPYRALAHADRLVRLRPEDPPVYWLRARTLQDLERYDAALQDLRRALRLGLVDPNRSQAKQVEVGLLIELGRVAEAKEALTDLADAGPEFWLRLGDLALRHGWGGLAVAAYRNARAGATPENRPATLRRLAQAEQGVGDWSAAQATLLDLVTLTDGDPWAFEQLGVIAERQEEFAAAASWATLASDTANDPALMMRAARLEVKAGYAVRALAQLDKVPVEQRPDGFLEFKAMVLMADQQYAPAATTFRAAARAAREDRALRADLLRSAVEASRLAGDVELELELRREVESVSGSREDRIALAERMIALNRSAAAAGVFAQLVREGDTTVSDAYVDALLAAGQAEAAIEYLTQRARWVEAATVAAEGGQWQDAADLFKQAYLATGGRDPALLQRALFAAERSGGRSDTVELLRRAYPFSNLPCSSRIEMTGRLARAHVRRDRGREALDAVIAVAREVDSSELALIAARLLAQTDCRRALEWAVRARRYGAGGAEPYAIEGQCAVETDDHRRAASAFQAAVATAESGGAPVDPGWLDGLALSLERSGRPIEALAARDRRLTLQYDAQVALSAAVTADRIGDHDRAAALRIGISPDALPRGSRAHLYDGLAADAERADSAQEALQHLGQAVTIEDTADRRFRMASALTDIGQTERATAELERAAKLQPDNVDIQAALAYAMLGAGDDAAAERYFAAALLLEPGHASLNEDSGYTNKRLARNEAAVDRFRAALDAYGPVDELSRDERCRIKREVRELSEAWRIEAAADLDLRGSTSGPASPLGDGIGGTGSLQASWRPPLIGYRSGRILEVFARTFWNNDENTARPDDDTLQGGVGARWKPLPEHNAYLSFERMVALGDAARDDWLARASVSFDQNTDWQPTRELWPTGTLYLDAARAVETDTTFLTAEARWGYAWQPSGRFVTPDLDDVVKSYLVASAARTDEGGEVTDEVAAGLGVEWRVWFDESEYAAHVGTAEISIEALAPVQTDRREGMYGRLRFRMSY